jgi:hypothetical protein
MMNLLKEMKDPGFNLPKTVPVVYCNHFEDNAGAIHLAKAPQMYPQTRHTNQPEVPSLPRMDKEVLPHQDPIS